MGGTFDPIHLGHLQIARAVARRLGLDRVLFVTAARPPHKTALRLTHACDRHAMVALALRREKKFVPSNVELHSGEEKNYSIRTIARIRRQLRHSDELFFIMGADQFAEFSSWRSFDRLLRSTAFIVISRPGCSLPAILRRCDSRIQASVRPILEASNQGGGRKVKPAAKPPAVYLVSDLKIEISSTAIRARIIAGKSTRGLLDPAVAEYIQKNGLYRP